MDNYKTQNESYNQNEVSVDLKVGEGLVNRLRDAAAEQRHLASRLIEKIVSLNGEFREPSPKGHGEQSERPRADFSTELTNQIIEVECNNNLLVMAIDRLNRFV